MAGDLVLVTGGSGFVGVHCIAQLLDAGHRVRTTVRSLSREAQVRQMLAVGGVAAAQSSSLSFVEADLLADAGWPEAVAGCRTVLHVASPFPAGAPAHEDELVRPAREGTLRVLRASRDAGVSRVVLTSSFAAIGYGVPIDGHVFDETDWSNPDSREISAYARSKTLAERAAWDFLAREGEALELSVVNPVAVLGPAWGADLSTSIEIVRRLLAGALPGLPRLAFGAVDVRDVADLHLRAMTDPAANGERFLAVAGENVSLSAIATILKERLGQAAARVPTRVLPDWLVRAVALFDRTAALAVPELGKVRRISNAKARRVLGWSPRSNQEAVLASAESLFALGVVERR